MADKIEKNEGEWREQLSPEEYQVTRQAGTEPAFTGRYWDDKTKGKYLCVCCGEELFSSDDKFESGSGWPSFTRASKDGNVDEHSDTAHGMTRVEIRCQRCEAHLGHVFPDGPAPSGQRYCVNSLSLKLEPEE
jgi:peptide-methionine (R)-S-oxide reductase